MNKKIEVLAPVGNMKMLEAAVKSGADAVYLGAEHFNARRNAENFGENELKNAIQYCHIRGVKVYLTLNIVVSDNEINDAVNTAKSAHIFGIDGIICTDLGLIDLLHKKFPLLPLHASTQMTTLSEDALPLLKKLGICRVVLPREMNREQIKIFCRKAKEYDIETEIFVHGALCMCVSGQCLLSAMLGGRSGNRGLCAGPCRLPFSANQNASDRYDLSLKDLSLVEYVKELTEIGVSSLKIEGRMKRPEYVAAAVSCLRGAVDTGKTDAQTLSTLKSVFSRSGFTDGYYTNALSPDMFGVRTRDDVVAANDVLAAIHELYRFERKNVPLFASIIIKSEQDIVLTLSDGKNTVTATQPPAQPAINRAITKEQILQNLLKLGSTPYYIVNADIILDDGLSVAAKVINSLRRDCVEKMDLLRSQSKDITECEIKTPRRHDNAPPQRKIFARFENAEQIPNDITGINYISLPLESNIKDVDLPKGAVLVADIPRTFNLSAVKNRLEEFKNSGFTHALTNTLADMQIAKEMGFKIICGSSFNAFNGLSVSWLSENGAEKVVLSPEMHIADAKKAAKNTGIIAYGNIPLMLTANCPINNVKPCSKCTRHENITDRKGISFPVRCRMGFSEILNSRPIWLADRLNELDFDFIMLYFSRETKEQAQRVINAYKDGGTPDGEYTRGLYYRGVE